MTVRALTDVDPKAKRWTVRDALVSLIEEIDAGTIRPDKLVLGYVWTENGRYQTGWRLAGVSRIEAVGLMMMTQDEILSERGDTDES